MCKAQVKGPVLAFYALLIPPHQHCTHTSPNSKHTEHKPGWHQGVSKMQEDSVDWWPLRGVVNWGLTDCKAGEALLETTGTQIAWVSYNPWKSMVATKPQKFGWEVLYQFLSLSLSNITLIFCLYSECTHVTSPSSTMSGLRNGCISAVCLCIA